MHMRCRLVLIAAATALATGSPVASAAYEEVVPPKVPLKAAHRYAVKAREHFKGDFRPRIERGEDREGQFVREETTTLGRVSPCKPPKNPGKPILCRLETTIALTTTIDGVATVQENTGDFHLGLGLYGRSESGSEVVSYHFKGPWYVVVALKE
jgi:hypothetical protein